MRKSPCKALFTLGVATVLPLCVTHAADTYWQGGTGNWTDLNWSLPAASLVNQPAPTSADYAIVNATGSVVTINSAATSNGFTLAAPSGAELRITTGGAYNASGSNYFLIGDNTGTGGSFHGVGPGTVTMNGGSLDYAGQFFIFGREFEGTLNQTGGTVTVDSPQLWIGQLAGATGTLNISGGTFKSTNTIGDANPILLGWDPGSYGRINLSGNGVVQIASTITVGGRSGRGSLDITGGSFTSGNLYVGRNNLTPAGVPSGSFNVSAGTVQTNGNLAIGFGGSASGSISGTASVNVTGGTYIGHTANSTGTLTVSGGSLTSNGNGQINYVGNLNGGNGILTLTGGTTKFWHLVQGSNGTAGTATTAVGTVNISNNAALAVSQDWRVGWGGTGVLNLDNSSTVTVGRNFVVEGANSQFNLTLSDFSDAVVVTGGTFLMNSSPSLNVTLSLQGVKVGDQFVIINAAGAAVTGGTFANKPNASTFQVSNILDPSSPYSLRINYNTGTDNRDVVLTVVTVPEPATGGLLALALVALGARRRRRTPSRC